MMTRKESARAVKRKKNLNLFSRQLKKIKRKINKNNYLKIMQERIHKTLWKSKFSRWSSTARTFKVRWMSLLINREEWSKRRLTWRLYSVIIVGLVWFVHKTEKTHNCTVANEKLPRHLCELSFILCCFCWFTASLMNEEDTKVSLLKDVDNNSNSVNNSSSAAVKKSWILFKRCRVNFSKLNFIFIFHKN